MNEVPEKLTAAVHSLERAVEELRESVQQLHADQVRERRLRRRTIRWRTITFAFILAFGLTVGYINHREIENAKHSWCTTLRTIEQRPNQNTDAARQLTRNLHELRTRYGCDTE